MSEGDIQVILHRLDQLSECLDRINEKVSLTNGRVTQLELEQARQEGIDDGRRMFGVIATSVISGGMLAGIIWFVSTAI